MENEKDEAQPRIDAMMQIVPDNWDRGPLVLAHELRKFLREAVADAGTAVDSGGGDGNADLWVTVGGVEYCINIRRSNGQLVKDGKRPPPDMGGNDIPTPEDDDD